MTKSMLSHGDLSHRITNYKSEPSLRYRKSYCRPDSDLSSILEEVEISVYDSYFTIDLVVKNPEKQQQIGLAFPVNSDLALRDHLYFTRYYDTVNCDEVSNFFQYIDCEIESLGTIESSEQDTLSDILGSLSYHLPNIKVYPDPFTAVFNAFPVRPLMLRGGDLSINVSAIEDIWLSSECYSRPSNIIKGSIISEINITNCNTSLEILVVPETVEAKLQLMTAFPEDFSQEDIQSSFQFKFIRQLETIDHDEVMQFLQYMDREIEPIGEETMQNMFNSMLSRYFDLTGSIETGVTFKPALQFSNVNKDEDDKKEDPDMDNSAGKRSRHSMNQKG